MADTVARAVKAFDPGPPILLAPVSRARPGGRARGPRGGAGRSLPTAPTPSALPWCAAARPGAVLHQSSERIAHVERMIEAGGVVTSGKVLETAFHSICVYGDNAHAVATARQLRAALEAAGHGLHPLPALFGRSDLKTVATFDEQGRHPAPVLAILIASPGAQRDDGRARGRRRDRRTSHRARDAAAAARSPVPSRRWSAPPYRLPVRRSTTAPLHRSRCSRCRSAPCPPSAGLPQARQEVERDPAAAGSMPASQDTDPPALVTDRRGALMACWMAMPWSMRVSGHVEHRIDDRRTSRRTARPPPASLF